MPKISEWHYDESTESYGYIYSERGYQELRVHSPVEAYFTADFNDTPLYIDEGTGIVVADWKKYEQHLQKEES